ncbi:MAG TPA: universal stress protein [Xanthobacteraceae bacterium]|jgi:nucleotide-binding universal stress UspA family protein
MIKNLVLNLSIGKDEDGARDYAISLAREFGAHLAAVAFAYEPIPATTLIDDAPGEWFDELREQAEKSANSAVERFNAAVRGSGILAEARALTTTLTGAADLFGRIARRFDLSLIQQAEPGKDSADPLVIEAALFDSGRPVLVVPYINQGGARFDRILVCWDGSRGAARAIGDAMPFIERSKAVEIVIVGDRPKSREIPGADIAQNLARHGAKAEVREIVAPDMDAGNVILSHAADSSADLMVMGGYGHSRLREFVLGGVTRTILSSMTLPTLISH